MRSFPRRRITGIVVARLPEELPADAGLLTVVEETKSASKSLKTQCAFAFCRLSEDSRAATPAVLLEEDDQQDDDEDEGDYAASQCHGDLLRGVSYKIDVSCPT